MTQNAVVTVTIRVTSGMTDEDLQQVASGLAEKFPKLVRDAERGGGSVSQTIIRDRLGEAAPATDPESEQRIRDIITRHRRGGL